MFSKRHMPSAALQNRGKPPAAPRVCSDTCAYRSLKSQQAPSLPVRMQYLPFRILIDYFCYFN